MPANQIKSKQTREKQNSVTWRLTERWMFFFFLMAKLGSYFLCVWTLPRFCTIVARHGLSWANFSKLCLVWTDFSAMKTTTLWNTVFFSGKSSVSGSSFDQISTQKQTNKNRDLFLSSRSEYLRSPCIATKEQNVSVSECGKRCRQNSF